MKTKKLMIILSFMLVFTFNCADDISTSNEKANTETNNTETNNTDIEIAGSWEPSDYEGKMLISNSSQTFSSTWNGNETTTVSTVIEFDNDDKYFITQGENEKYNHSYWILTDDSILYTCSLLINMDSLEEAKNAPEPSDPDNPEATGSCGTITGFDGNPYSFAWSKYTKSE